MVHRALAPAFLLGCGLASGCGSSSGVPPIDPALYLRVGSDLETEAPRAERALREAGYVVDARVAGRTFVAFGAHHPNDGRTHVRIVSASGVDLGLTAPDPRRLGLEEVSVASTEGGSHDIDGDGYEEVLVRVVETSRPAACLGVVRVGEGGQLREVPVGTLRLNPQSCVESVGPAVGGEGLRLWATVRFVEVAHGGEVPSVRVPLRAQGGAFGPPAPGEEREAFEAAASARRVLLEQARAAGAVEDALRLGVELAALARFDGAGSAAQLAAFDEAVEGLAFDVEGRGARVRARRFIEGGWGAVASPAADDDGQGTAGEAASHAPEAAEPEIARDARIIEPDP